MPRGDRTGPMGEGSMTGRGAGYCAGYNRPGYTNQIPWRGFGMSWRGGRGFGWGGGLRGGGWFYGSYVPRPYGYYGFTVPAYDKESESKFLRAEATRIKDALDEIEKRLEELEEEK